MKIYKCDRCGKVMDKKEAEITLGLETMSITAWGYESQMDNINKDLCEQCYQTIKEVLEDGEIK